MGDFDILINHLKRKKAKIGEEGIIDKPNYHISHNNKYDCEVINIEYNYHSITVYYDKNGNIPLRPYYNYYYIQMTRPTVITTAGIRQDLGFYEKNIWVHDIEDVWHELQIFWKRTIM